ncbi:MAG: hypothetical protein ACTH5M_10220 [Psychrobacter sp.]
MMSQSIFKRFSNRYLASSAKQSSRLLTVREVALARSVFGNSINLDEVQLKTAWWVLKNYAVSPNGNIYWWCSKKYAGIRRSHN